MIKLTSPNLHPTTIQTIRLRVRTNMGTRSQEFTKVVAMDEFEHGDHCGLFGPYLVSASAWRHGAKKVKLYHCPPPQSTHERQTRTAAGYDLNLPDDLVEVDVDKDHGFITENGYYPREFLISIPPSITRTNFEQAWREITNNPTYRTYNQGLTANWKKQEQLTSEEIRLLNERRSLVLKTAAALLMGVLHAD